MLWINKYRKFFSDSDVVADELSKIEVQRLDARIKNSGDVSKESFSFSDKVVYANLDADEIDDVVNFLKQHLDELASQVVLLCDDSGDIGFRLKFDDVLRLLPQIEEFRRGHLYICNETGKLIAIIHLALWTYVRL